MRTRGGETREHKDLPAFSGKMFARAVIRGRSNLSLSERRDINKRFGSDNERWSNSDEQLARVAIRLGRICRQRVEEISVKWNINVVRRSLNSSGRCSKWILYPATSIQLFDAIMCYFIINNTLKEYYTYYNLNAFYIL